MSAGTITHPFSLRSDAISIFETALAACDIRTAFNRHIRFDGLTLERRPSRMLHPLTQSFEGIKRVQIVAFGKASVPMLDALLEQLPPKLRVDGICSALQLPAKRHRHIRYFEGSHPLPNEESFEAAEAAIDLLKKANRDTFVFFLVSGGGSAMFELPKDKNISLDDVRAFYETLVFSGADITEMNTVRKFFSSVKGGQLARKAPDAQKLTLLIADVPMKDLGVVASSPTLPDRSAWSDCQAILHKWDLLPRFPSSIRRYFQTLSVSAPEPHAEAIPNSQVDVLLSNHDFVNAARDRARALGYKVLIDNSCDNWPYEKASDYLLERFKALRAEFKRVCLLSSGEVTVQFPLESHPGCGGRNQQFALLSALALERSSAQTVVLSGGSDGIDGNSPAAGAIVDETTAARARSFHFDPEQSLVRFNACPLFTALGDALMTGPTGNNLRDLRVLLADDPA